MEGILLYIVSLILGSSVASLRTASDIFEAVLFLLHALLVEQFHPTA